MCVNGTSYFGTDFSSRPNYLETLNGSKYMFPPKAFKMYCSALDALDNRYILAVSKQLEPVGNRKALSIFDAEEQKYIYCDYFDPVTD